MSDLGDIVQEYAKNPLCNFVMDDFTVKQHEGNFICWDDIVVYLVIKDNEILKYSFDWNCSTVTTAAASLLSEFIVWNYIYDVLKWSYQNMVAWGFEVSPRRKRAAVIAILAVRNAIHKYIKDWKEDTFEDVIDD